MTFVEPSPNMRVQRTGYVALLAALSFACATAGPKDRPTNPVLRYQSSDGQWHQDTSQIVKPGLETRNDIDWPVGLRTKENAGVVVLNELIERDGSVQDVVVTQSLSPAMDEIALQTVRHWHYKPATFQGEPVAVWYYVTVTFKLGF